MLEILETFNSHPFLAQLPARDRMALVAGAQPFTYRPGEFLAVAGTKAETFYLIQSGEVAVCSIQADFGELLVQKIGPGEVVGWSWLIPPYIWSFTCQAVGEVRGIKFDAWWLRDLCDRDHEIGYRVLKYLVQVIARRLTSMRYTYGELFSANTRPIHVRPDARRPEPALQ
jgi:CRP-like cAMP-binding protein